MVIKKSNKANIEKKRGAFFSIGILVSVSLILLAFEWKTFHAKDKVVYDDVKELEEDLVYVMPNYRKEVVTKKPKPNKHYPIEKKTEDTNYKTVEETQAAKNINNDIDHKSVKEPDVLIEESSLSPVDESPLSPEPEFEKLINEPSYPGGYSNMKHFIQRNIDYPLLDREKSVTGKVFVSFVVDENGDITEVEILQSPSERMSKEVMKMLLRMPKWIPGSVSGKALRRKYILPISFIIKD